MKKIILLFLFLLPVACGKIAEPYVDPYAENDFAITGLTLDNFPFMDCSTSTSPLRDMVMYHLLDIPYAWGLNVVSGSQ